MSNTRPVRRSLSIEELAAEKPEPPVRKSLGSSVLPKDPDWWFPSYVPAWARMLPRELYASVFQMSSAVWQFDEALRRYMRPRKRGRPRLTDEQEDRQFVLQVEGTKRLLASTIKRASDSAALRQIFGRKNVGPERARLYRLRKAAQK